jgi:hypothetical protein
VGCRTYRHVGHFLETLETMRETNKPQAHRHDLVAFCDQNYVLVGASGSCGGVVASGRSLYAKTLPRQSPTFIRRWWTARLRRSWILPDLKRLRYTVNAYRLDFP